MFKVIISVILSVVATGLFSVFAVFPYINHSIISKSKKLTKEVKELQSNLQNANDELRGLKEEVDKLSKRNRDLEDIGKVRVLNIMAMYQISSFKSGTTIETRNSR